jgi:hypothetical protein
MTLLERFKEYHEDGCVGITLSLAKEPVEFRDKVLAAVVLDPTADHSFVVDGKLYFWCVGELVDGRPCLLVGPMEDY